jgi:hypothetical protein
MSLDELKQLAKAILSENASLKLQLLHKDFIVQQLEKEKANLIDQLRDCQELKKDVVTLRAEMASLLSQFKALTSAFGARDMASTFERELMVYIWRECLSKPFYIYSLKNLKKFLKHPETAYDAGICGQSAFDVFSAKSEEELQSIRKRLTDAARLIDLPVIEVLKNVSNDVAHRQFAEPSELIEFFRTYQKPEVADAIAELLRAKNEFDDLRK